MVTARRGSGAAIAGQRLLAYAAVPLAFALLIGLVYLAGGFGRRTDRLTPVAPGATITTGPFELSFTEATAQALVNSDKIPGWEVVLIGRARNISDETTKASTFGDDGLFSSTAVRSWPAEPRRPRSYGGNDREGLTAA